MKRHCIESARVQDFLDDLLEAPEAEAFRRHLEDCAACAAEVVAYQRVFQSIAHAPRLDPGPVFTERVLEAVVPARIRRRWLRTVGWSYAGSLAASVAAAGLVASFPGSRAWFEGASAAVPQHADRKSTRLNSSHPRLSRMPSSA